MTYFSSTTKEQYDAYLERPDLVETITLYTAPQPAGPVDKSKNLQGSVVDKAEEMQGQPAAPAQEPSDDIDIDDVRQYLEAWGCLAHPGDRALLARYGQNPTIPAGWKLVPAEPTIDMMFMGVSEWSVHDDPEEDHPYAHSR